ncbi:MAG: hypothetical protein BIFFINMI_03933 [Phycisphaerae bacterium]|nr:hypothetical protein [Phycisphaerae bacterium]
MKAKATWVIAAAYACAWVAPQAWGRDWYVSAARGAGKTGTAEKPVKDLGSIVSRLGDGDRVFIAEGTYLGRGDNGCDQIDKAVEIYGGFADDFSKRDPWGVHKTILSGSNTTKNWVQGYRLSIDLGKRRDLRARHKVVVDGLIVDHGDRNRYADKTDSKIVRMADPKTGKNPTPEYGGISVAVTKLGDIVVRNCVVLNTASSGNGAISVWGSEKSEVTVENNIACNNTGYGFYLHTAFYPDELERMPQFKFSHNVAAFSSKPDPGATHGGSGLKVDAATRVTAEWNVLAFGDYYGVDNASQAKRFVLNNNLFVVNLQGDYLEFDTKMKVADIEDDSDKLEEATGNVASDKLRPKVSREWAQKYLSRQVVDRNAKEADVKAVQSGANELRSILGLPLEGTSVGEYSDVWLPRIGIDDALVCGNKPVLEKYGSKDPGQSEPIK